MQLGRILIARINACKIIHLLEYHLIDDASWWLFSLSHECKGNSLLTASRIIRNTILNRLDIRHKQFYIPIE